MLPQELCAALEHDRARLEAAKEAAEQRTRELRREGELLRKNLEQQTSVNREEERSCRVGAGELSWAGGVAGVVRPRRSGPRGGFTGRHTRPAPRRWRKG